MVSFDIESLFTNVPLTETIDIICQLAYSKNDPNFVKGQTWNGITERQLRKLLLKATQESHFVFNGKYYDQIDGIAMGSPLGPTFANIFIADLERKLMDNLH